MQPNKKMKVGIMGNGFINWGGGIDFLKVYINCLMTQDCEIILLIPEKDTTFHGIKKEIIRMGENILKKMHHHKPEKRTDCKMVVDNFLREFPDLVYILYDVRNLNRVCKDNQIDILFPYNEIVRKINVPWIGYVYDFQHEYFPEFFSRKTCLSRQREFGHMLNEAKAIVTNSADSKNDCQKYYPGHKARVYVTPFSPVPRQEWLKDNSFSIIKYNINYPYFIICNQMWQHKGHICALEAFKHVIENADYSEYHLICTGAMTDERNQNYVDSVKKKIRELGLQEKVSFLGYIPKIEQIELLKHSKLVIQPTLFEGGPGGGVAVDAISLGKPIVLSDIRVNREIDSEFAFFFKAGDSQSLSETIITVLHNEPDCKNVDELQEQGKIIRNNLGQYIITMLEQEIQFKKEEERCDTGI